MRGIRWIQGIVPPKFRYPRCGSGGKLEGKVKIPEAILDDALMGSTSEETRASLVHLEPEARKKLDSMRISRRK